MNHLTEWVKNILRPVTAMEMAKNELEEAKRQLLNAQSATEYAARMAAYHGDRIKRLSAYVTEKQEPSRT